MIPPELNGREDLRQFNPTRPYLIQFPTVCRGKAETLDLVQEIRRLRNRIVYHFGFTLPAFDIEFSDRLEADEFRFSVYEIPKVMGTFNTGCVAVEARWLESLSAQEQQALSASAESTAVAAPASGRGRRRRRKPRRSNRRWAEALRQEADYLWLPADHPLLENEAVARWTAAELLLKRMENAIHASSPHFIGLQETRALMGWLESEQPELAQELQRVMPLARFSSVLQKLVAERIPLRSVRAIAEALIEHGQHERDVFLLTEQVRITLKTHLCHQYSRGGRHSRPAAGAGAGRGVARQPASDAKRHLLRAQPGNKFSRCISRCAAPSPPATNGSRCCWRRRICAAAARADRRIFPSGAGAVVR